MSASALSAGEPAPGRPPSALTEQAPGEFVAPGATTARVPSDGPARKAITALMHEEFPDADADDVVGEVVRGDNGTDLTKYVAGEDGDGYEVTIYRHFAVEELKALPGLEAEGGTAWLGTDVDGVTSIYFRSADSEVGLRLADLWSTQKDKVGAQRLVQLAQTLSASGAVREEAQR